MMQLVDSLLDRLTMYRLTFYYLIVLVALGFSLSLFGLIRPGPRPSFPTRPSCWSSASA